MRTAHATSAISTPSTPTSSVHGALTTGGGGGGDAHSSDAEMSASTSSLGGSASILNVAIAQSQALREKVLQLPVGKDREGWERECIDVCGLLAYKDLATCPVRGYLSQSRRDILAEMVNSAILREFSARTFDGGIAQIHLRRRATFPPPPVTEHTGRTPLSLLSLAARQATAIWDTLREMWHPFPPPEAITTGRDRDSNNGKNKPPRVRVPRFPRFPFSFRSFFPSTSCAGEWRIGCLALSVQWELMFARSGLHLSQTFPIFDLHTFLRDRDGAPSTSPPDPPVDNMET